MTPKILLVDDRAENFLALEGILRRSDTALLKAESGSRALELLLDHDVALAIVDVQMPEMDGFELAELMRGLERTRQIPIIFVTAGMHDQARLFKGYDTGAVDFLVKPLEPRILTSKVEVFLQLYRQNQQLASRVEQLEEALATRRRVEDALKKSEESLLIAMRAGGVGSVTLDFVLGKADVSSTYREMFGFLPDEAVTFDTWAARLHPDDREAAISFHRGVLDGGGSYQHKYRLALPDGSVRWIESSGTVFHGADGRATRLTGVVRDVTPTEEANLLVQQARERSAWLARLPEENPDPVVRVYKDGTVLYANPGAEAASDAWRTAGTGTAAKLLPALLDAVQSAVERGEVVHTEIPHGERTLWVALNPAGDEVGLYFRDVTERTQGEGFSRALNAINQLIHSRRGFDEIMQGAIELAGKALAAETAAVSLRKNGRWSVSFVAGLPKENVGMEMSDQEEKHAMLAIAEQSPVAIGDAWGDERVNREHVMRWGIRAVLVVPLIVRGKAMGSVFFNYHKGPVTFGAAHLDFAAKLASAVSLAIENAQLFADLEQSEHSLRQADARKNEFLAVLSHELRNPLAPIKNSLYILDHASAGGEQARRAKQVIDRQVNQLADLINDLLDVTRVTTNKVKLQRGRLALYELVRRTIEDNRSLFEKGNVRLDLDEIPNTLFVNADSTRLAQVLGNLLQNAAKFTGSGGRTRVSVSSEDGEAVIRVSDSGIGMRPETLARLFQPFMQAEQSLDRSKGGLGLGLALVKGLVELHGGKISAHSDGLGQGATFTVRLPLDSGSASQPARASADRPVKARRRVLIIEDNMDAADSLREVIAFAEHEVDVAYNGPDGIAKAHVFRPDIVLCDIGLPGMDGFQVARAFRADETLKDVALVALSGYALPEDLQRAREAGFARHLAKPLGIDNLEELLATVKPLNLRL